MKLRGLDFTFSWIFLLIICSAPVSSSTQATTIDDSPSALAGITDKDRAEVEFEQAQDIDNSIPLRKENEKESAPHYPFPQHLTYRATDTILPNHHSQEQLDMDVENLYDYWKNRYLIQMGTEEDGHPRYRVKSSRAGDAGTVSEGQGYGMMIVALMAGYDSGARTIFDGLWEFALDHTSENDARLMDWSVPSNEQLDPEGNDSAFDGDCDMAYALLFAEQQWGDTGRFRYGVEAKRVISGILDSTIGPQSHLPMLGDWVQPNGPTYNQYTPRPSDFMPSHFRVFGIVTENTATWYDVVPSLQGVVTALQADFSPNTGLLPDFVQPVSSGDPTPRPADPDFLETHRDGMYFYNACRTPWRLGLDALLSGDRISRTQARRISEWFRRSTNGVATDIRAGYELDGSVITGFDFFSTAFAAPVGVAAMLEPSEQSWLNDIYESVRGAREDYYEDSINLLCLLAMTGNFWSPVEVSPNETLTPDLNDDGDVNARDLLELIRQWKHPAAEPSPRFRPADLAPPIGIDPIDLFRFPTVWR